MNFKQIIHDELKDRHLTEREKLRYIYKRACEEFYFDHRWFYTDTLHDQALANHIEKRHIDLENVDDFSVVCHTMSREVLKPLIDEFTSFKTRTVLDRCHTTLNVTEPNGIVWNLDATCGDMPRVKLNVAPIGMKSESVHPVYLDDMDFDIGFLFDGLDDYLRMVNASCFPDLVRKIGKILDITKVKYNYSDTRFFMKLYSYMMLCDTETYLDENYNFHRLMNLCDDNAYFDVCKKDDCFKLYEINEDEYNRLVKTLRCK